MELGCRSPGRLGATRSPGDVLVNSHHRVKCVFYFVSWAIRFKNWEGFHLAQGGTPNKLKDSALERWIDIRVTFIFDFLWELLYTKSFIVLHSLFLGPCFAVASTWLC